MKGFGGGGAHVVFGGVDWSPLSKELLGFTSFGIANTSTEPQKNLVTRRLYPDPFNVSFLVTFVALCLHYMSPCKPLLSNSLIYHKKTYMIPLHLILYCDFKPTISDAYFPTPPHPPQIHHHQHHPSLPYQSPNPQSQP